MGENEVFVPIYGFEKYKISNLGRIKSFKGLSPKILKNRIKRGYSQCVLYSENKPINFLVHRLVAIAFIPNEDNKPYINHIDGNKSNNSVCNLEWCTHVENINHALKMRLDSFGKSGFNYKFSDEDISKIRFLYLSKNKKRKELSKLFNISTSHLDKILKNKIRI